MIGEASRGRGLIGDATAGIGVAGALLAPGIVGVALEHAARFVADDRDRTESIGMEVAHVVP